MFKALSVICKQKGFAEENSIGKVTHVYDEQEGTQILLPCGTPDSTGSRQELYSYLIYSYILISVCNISMGLHLQC